MPGISRAPTWYADSCYVPFSPTREPTSTAGRGRAGTFRRMSHQQEFKFAAEQLFFLNTARAHCKYAYRLHRDADSFGHSKVRTYKRISY